MRFRKVVVIGLDGLEPAIVDALMLQGQLPNFRKLALGEPSRRIQTTYPAQTPVAWSSFATGVNPGGHGIFDFIRREPGTYLPTAALNRFEQKNRFLPPKAVNCRKGVTVWEILGAAGVPSTILRCPCTFPPQAFRGRLLSGMGVPDLVGGFGTSTYYSLDPVITGESETALQLECQGDEYSSQLLGPRHPKTRDRIPIRFRLRLDGERASLVSDQHPRELLLVDRKWSDWLHLKFPIAPLVSVRGMVRVLFISSASGPQLYVSPVNFDPAAPLFPLSHPPGYAKELCEQIGPFYTTGMVEDHAGLSNRRLDEGLFLEHCEALFAERMRMLHHELARLEEGLLYCLFDTPDRLQHMFWRYREPDHPANRGKCSDTYADVIDAMYRRCDEIVGEVLSAIDDRTLLLVLSDHGFGSFRRGLNLNNWLHENGYLKLLPGVVPGQGTGEGFIGFDWRGTRAYSLGLGSIYLNRKGREPEGIVDPAEASKVIDGIAMGLSGLRDPKNSHVAVRRVKRSSEIYQGPYIAEGPDLLALFDRGYRASWKTSLGEIATTVWEDNDRLWSGDHIVDPELVPGVLFANRSLAPCQANMIDMAPTILAALGVPVPAHFEGKGLMT